MPGIVSTPMEVSLEDAGPSKPTKQTRRLQSKFLNLCSRYVLKDRSFGRQYYVFYTARLQAVEVALKELAARRWIAGAIVASESERPEMVDAKSLCDDLIGKKLILVGCLYKQMSMHPSILKEVCQEEGVIMQPISVTHKYTSEDDVLELQDYRENVGLVGSGMNVAQHVTGIPVALLGQLTTEGSKFNVEDMLYYGETLSIPRIPPAMDTSLEESDRLVVLVSGLGFTDADWMTTTELKRLFQSLELLSGYLTGHFDPSRSAHVVRLICAGNFLAKSLIDDEEKERVKALRQQTNTGKSGKIRAPLTLTAIRKFDRFLSRIGQFLPVDVMPGQCDPGNSLLPQQPLHPCLFPAASQLGSITCTTNPYYAAIDGHVFLGTSGQPIDAVKSYSDLDDSTQILAKSLQWGHLCPSAPDNLASYPFPDKDPFLMKELPHVYFAGNQPTFGSTNVAAPADTLAATTTAGPPAGSGDAADGLQLNSTLVISVPEFSSTFMAVAVNLRTRKCELLSFS